MGLLVDIRDDVAATPDCRETMARKKRKATKRTPEEQAAYDERTRKAWERIAEREARDREEERRRAAD
jgi:hypothetical protein